MTMIMWKECKNGHLLTDPANVYVTPQGHRRCRTCKRESDRRTRPERTPGMAPPPVYVSRKKYRKWAETIWQEMSEHDRWLIGHALGYMNLEQAVS